MGARVMSRDGLEEAAINDKTARRAGKNIVNYSIGKPEQRMITHKSQIMSDDDGERHTAEYAVEPKWMV